MLISFAAFQVIYAKTAKIEIGAHDKLLIRRCSMKTENTTETPIYLVLNMSKVVNNEPCAQLSVYHVETLARS